MNTGFSRENCTQHHSLILVSQQLNRLLWFLAVCGTSLAGDICRVSFSIPVSPHFLLFLFCHLPHEGAKCPLAFSAHWTFMVPGAGFVAFLDGRRKSLGSIDVSSEPDKSSIHSIVHISKAQAASASIRCVILQFQSGSHWVEIHLIKNVGDFGYHLGCVPYVCSNEVWWVVCFFCQCFYQQW